jgi:hypothetical protein
VTAASSFTTVGTYLFGGTALSGLLWADDLATWKGRLWVICIVAASLCIVGTFFARSQQARELQVLRLGLDLSRMSAAEAENAGPDAPPRTRHLVAVREVGSES